MSDNQSHIVPSPCSKFINASPSSWAKMRILAGMDTRQDKKSGRSVGEREERMTPVIDCHRPSTGSEQYFFRPQFLHLKPAHTESNWFMADSTRTGSSVMMPASKLRFRVLFIPRPAPVRFADAIYCAIEHTLAALDYYYLRNGHCIKDLLLQVHPSYNREEMFKLTGKIKSFTDKLIKKAKPLKWDEESIDDQPATDPVRTATADIPSELSSPEAMRYWHRAQDAQLLDEHFHFIGTKTELTVFVATFSTVLFKEIRWSPFDQWQPYRNYAKTYCEYNNRKNQKLTPKIQTTMDVFRA